MENKTAKISAYQLYNIVMDTNKKVTELEKRTAENEAFVNTIGLRLSLLLMVFGAAFIVSALFPVTREFVGMTFSSAIWNGIYLAYSAVTVGVAFLSNIRKEMWLITVIMAIAPLTVSALNTI